MLSGSMWDALLNDILMGFTDLTDKEHLNRLFVRSGYRRCGVATTLLTMAEQAAWQRRMIRLTIDASLTALRFFKARGFGHERRSQTLDNSQMESCLRIRVARRPQCSVRTEPDTLHIHCTFSKTPQNILIQRLTLSGLNLFKQSFPLMCRKIDFFPSYIESVVTITKHFRIFDIMIMSSYKSSRQLELIY
ncbi:hypothetical protein B9G99_11125 [Kushneria konosiri]|uniref:N-acetyltransferase domain-containing protein n=1 Tax=Kushneria konosiri TaxID=698828 RepID=A0A2Z2H7I1_9GAMM|nr:hypothetical protein B9G99_11125 [Kushneria konosiri]